MKLKRLAALCTSAALTLALAVVPAHAVTFTDLVKPDGTKHWAYDYITRMSGLGYANGYEDGTFKPDGNMTAVEALLFCARCTGVDARTQEKVADDWEDIVTQILPEGMASWASRPAKELAVGVEAGVLSLAELEALSDSGALMRTITRENLCMYLVRAMQLEPLVNELTTYPLAYPDRDDISPALQPYVFVLTNFGIVQGDEVGKFNPKGYVTRAAMTTMLCRALDFMKESGIVVQLSEYTDFDWQGGTVTNVTFGVDGSTVLTLRNDVSDVLQSYSLPASAQVYEHNMLTSSAALKKGQYVRLELDGKGLVTAARICGGLSTFLGNVDSLKNDQLTLTVNGVSRSLTIDRFTSVAAGKAVGDKSIIDEEAQYTTAVCYVDAAGHLAGVKLSGGSEQAQGLVKALTATGDDMVLQVAANNGVIYRYTIPAGTAVLVDGVLGRLTTAHVGCLAQLRVDTETDQAISVSVSTAYQYVQGPIRRTGTIGTAKSLTIGDIFTGKDVTCTVSTTAPITYNGGEKTISQIENGWYVTAVLSKGSAGTTDMIIQLDGFPGTTAVEGTLSDITYAATTTLQITEETGGTLSYDLDIKDPPDITRNKKSCSVADLRRGDRLVITLRYNEVSKIEATPQTADLRGKITGISVGATGRTMEITFDDGSTAQYTVNESVSVSQDGKSSNVGNLNYGDTVALVTSGGEIVSIEILSTAVSSEQLTGTIYDITPSGSNRSLYLLTAGNSAPVYVDLKNVGSVVDLGSSGKTVTLNSLKANDSVTIYGSWNGSTFVATAILKQ